MGDLAAASSIVVPAELGRLGAVRAFVRKAVLEATDSDEAAADLVQAVDEIVSNVIEHGYDGSSGTVEVEVAIRGAEATVHVRDACPPFDPTGLPTPDTEAPLASRPLGGMGVHLSKVLTDRMTHRILPSGGNELTLVKLIGTAGGGQQRGDRD